jgi:hypothetical protein
VQRIFFEVTNGLNWGKFLVGRFNSEWAVPSALDGAGLIRSRGWGPDHLLVMDLQTGEGALFPVRPISCAHADLEKHKIWVCPMFEPFLEWLYEQDIDALMAAEPSDVSRLVELPAAPASWFGYRREGVATEQT